MELYLIRHSVAQDLGANGNYLDEHRALTEDGLRRAEKVGKGLRKIGVGFNVILTSPSKRCVQTAETIRLAMRLPEHALIVTPELGLDHDTDSVLRLLNERYRELGQVALIGHQPNLGEIGSSLLVEDRTIEFKMSRAGVICLQTGPLVQLGTASLLWKLLPGQLIKLSE